MTSKLARVPFATLLGLSLFGLGACSSDSDSGAVSGGLVVFASRGTEFAVAPDAPVAVGGQLFAYLADEASETSGGAGGTDLNGDGDAVDRVAVVFPFGAPRGTPLAAARAVHVIASEVWLVVSEAEDGVDHDLDGMLDDLVLLHGTQTTDLALVARLANELCLVASERLYFNEALEVGPALPATDLRWVDAAQPRLPVAVLGDGAAGTIQRLTAHDEGLLILLQSELVELAELNGDGDATDERVLALLDTRDPAGVVHNVALAVGDGAPVRARRTVAGDTLVAFLVDEQAQGATNLNDPAIQTAGWQPSQCVGFEDVDTDDFVLFHLRLNSFLADPLANAPINTGLVGRDRVVCVEAGGGALFVGTISFEVDEGTCALNGDGDQADGIFRWTQAAFGFVPPPIGDVGFLFAVADLPGGAAGVVEVSDRFVVAVSEAEDARDHDGDPSTNRDFLAGLEPGDLPIASWRFFQRQSVPAHFAADWLAPAPNGTSFLFGDVEAEYDFPCNIDDQDTDDVFPLAARLSADGLSLVASGYCVAGESFNSGPVQTGNVLFVRSSEQEQSRDLNEDGDQLDNVLLCHTLFPTGRLFFVGTLNDLPLPAVFTGPNGRVVYLVDETMAGRDLNGDGDATDFVLRTLKAF